MNISAQMLALHVDYNERERLPDGGQAVAIFFSGFNPDALEKKLSIGARVTLYDSGTVCQGILRHGKWLDGWVADIIPGTVRDMRPGELERLEKETRRAALGFV